MLLNFFFCEYERHSVFSLEYMLYSFEKRMKQDFFSKTAGNTEYTGIPAKNGRFPRELERRQVIKNQASPPVSRIMASFRSYFCLEISIQPAEIYLKSMIFLEPNGIQYATEYQPLFSR